MIKTKLCLFICTFLAQLFTYASASDPPEFRLNAKQCEAIISVDDPVQRGSCQTPKACEPYMSLIPYVNPAEGPICGKDGLLNSKNDRLTENL